MYQAEELLKKVNEALDGLAYDRQPYSLYEPIKYVLAIGGKRVRWPIISTKTTLSGSLLRPSVWRPITTLRCCMTI